MYSNIVYQITNNPLPFLYIYRFFVNSYRANLYETEVEYANEWRQVAEKMVEEGKWELYGVLNFEKYCKMSTGRMDIYKILG